MGERKGELALIEERDRDRDRGRGRGRGREIGDIRGDDEDNMTGKRRVCQGEEKKSDGLMFE